jgi:hypothetical protein
MTDEENPGHALDDQGLPQLPVYEPFAADSVQGLARLAALAAWHTGQWGVKTTVRNWARVGRAATDRAEAAALIRDVTDYVVVLGEIARQVADGRSIGEALLEAGEALGGESERWLNRRPADSAAAAGRNMPKPAALRERGTELLERSRDVWSMETRHPAYDRILDDLAPDEARILVMLLRSGPQPTVDVRTGGPLAVVSSQLVARGLNMLGPRAGVRYLDRVPSYLNNLDRLGLIWLSRESIQDHQEYQVLEAQPDVLAALKSVRFARVVRGSIHLTPFGAEFVRLALVDESTAADVHLPEHGAPKPGIK